MKYLILSLLLFSVNSFAANGSGNVSNVLNIGGGSLSPNLVVAEDNTQGYFSMVAGGSTSTGNAYYPFYKNGAIYQVPSGKTFKVTKVCMVTDGSSNQWQFVSATATFARGASSGTLTGPVYQSGVNANFAQFNNVTGYVPLCFDLNYSFAASTWPGMQPNTGIGQFLTVWGKEI